MRGAHLEPPNPFTLTISGLPAGVYGFRTHHHAPQNQTGLIDIPVNDSTGANPSADFEQSAGGGAGAVPAIFEATLSSDGGDIDHRHRF